MTQLLVGLGFGLGISGSFGLVATLFGIARDGSPFRREFWT